MPRDKPPLPWEPSDWLGSTRVAAMTADQERGYFRLLNHLWASPDCALRDDDTLLAKLSLMDERWAADGAPVRACLIPHPDKPGYVTNERLLATWLAVNRRRKAAEDGQGDRNATGIGRTAGDGISDVRWQGVAADDVKAGRVAEYLSGDRRRAGACQGPAMVDRQRAQDAQGHDGVPREMALEG